MHACTNYSICRYPSLFKARELIPKRVENVRTIIVAMVWALGTLNPVWPHARVSGICQHDNNNNNNILAVHTKRESTSRKRSPHLYLHERALTTNFQFHIHATTNVQTAIVSPCSSLSRTRCDLKQDITTIKSLARSAPKRKDYFRLASSSVLFLEENSHNSPQVGSIK